MAEADLLRCAKEYSGKRMTDSACQSALEGGWAGIPESPSAFRAVISSLIFNSTMGVGLFDRDLYCLALSPLLGRMVTVSVEGPVGKAIHELFAEEAPFIEASLRAVWESGNALSDVEISRRHGYRLQECVWSLNVYPVKDESGQVQMIAATFSDVTKRRCAERKLCRLRDKFEEAAQGEKSSLGEEFADLSARAYELAERSVKLLNSSMVLRRHTVEMRIEAGLARAALVLSGTHYREIFSDTALSQVDSCDEPPLQSGQGNEKQLEESGPSPRERQLLYFLADGKSNKEIGFILEISTRTVESYRARVMLKLGLHSTAALVRYAIRHHIVEA